MAAFHTAHRTSMMPLLSERAIEVCEEMYLLCKKIALSDTFEETLIYIVSEDITRQDFKHRSYDGLVWKRVGNQTVGSDCGNYFYAVLWQISIFYGVRHKKNLDVLYQDAIRRYPTLACYHDYNKKVSACKAM